MFSIFPSCRIAAKETILNFDLDPSVILLEHLPHLGPGLTIFIFCSSHEHLHFDL
jgi:hypothetical protein